MYSDGLAAFSIYVEPMPESGAATMVSQNGATVAVTHQINEQGQYFLVTLVGEIPVDTARKIVATVHQKSS
jgi:sigma-E factor negative regulatory protein RseB